MYLAVDIEQNNINKKGLNDLFVSRCHLSSEDVQG